MFIQMNKGDAIMLQSNKSTIKVQVDQNGLIEITHCD